MTAWKKWNNAFLFTIQVGEVGQVNGAVRAEVEVTKKKTPLASL
jgi:hypothetical protein